MFLRNYFLESLKRKIPGSFVSHIRYCLIFKFLISATGRPVRAAVSLTAYLFYHSFFHLSRGFENFFLEVFEALRASNLPKGFQSPLKPGFVGCPERFARDSLYMLPQLEENVNSKNPNWDIAFFYSSIQDETILFVKLSDRRSKRFQSGYNKPENCLVIF